MTDEIADIKQFFDSHQVRLSPIWLRDCIKWCKEESLPNDYELKDLKYKVFEQWLLLDLRDVEIPCLPPNISNKLKYILNGNFSLQIMKVVDISKPKYWQIQKIRNQTIKNNLEKDDTASSKRVLMLTLSDGVQEVEAMEYKPIPSLSLNLTPGLKLRLMGPITVRRGRLMLENNNIKIIGGEVDTLMVSNAAENILAAALNLPLNPDPFVIQESLLTANADILNNADVTSGHVSNNQSTLPSTNSLPQQVLPHNRTNNNSLNNQSTLPVSTRLPQQSLSSVNVNDRKNKPVTTGDYMDDMQAFLEDEELINAEIAEMERQAAERPQVNSSSVTARKTPDIFEDMDLDDAVFANIEVPEIGRKSPQKKTTNNTNIKTILSKRTNTDLNLSGSNNKDDDFFDDLDLDDHLNKLEEKMAKDQNQLTSSQPAEPALDNVTASFEARSTGNQKTALSNIWPIEKLIKNLKVITNGKFKIKAKFKTIMEKLTLTEDKFHLVVEVEDGSGSVTVSVHSDVVAGFAKCTPAQLNMLKANIQQNIVDAQAKVVEHLRALKENLQNLDNVVELQVKSTEKYPILLRIVE